MAQFDRITFDPAVMGGKACIRGLRVTAGTVLGLLAAGRSRDEILTAYPYLEPEDIDQCLAWRRGVWKSVMFHWHQHEHQNPDRHELGARLGG